MADSIGPPDHRNSDGNGWAWGIFRGAGLFCVRVTVLPLSVHLPVKSMIPGQTHATSLGQGEIRSPATKVPSDRSSMVLMYWRGPQGLLFHGPTQEGFEPSEPVGATVGYAGGGVVLIGEDEGPESFRFPVLSVQHAGAESAMRAVTAERAWSVCMMGEYPGLKTVVLFPIAWYGMGSMANEALISAVKNIVALKRANKLDEHYLAYRDLFSSPDFLTYRAEDQYQALNLLIHGKITTRDPSPTCLEAHNAAISPLIELISADRDPAAYELLGICYMRLGDEVGALKIFREGLELERQRNPQSNLCGALMKWVASL